MHRKLFYLLIFLLPAQIGYHFWPSWSFVLGRRVDYLSPTIYLTDLVLLALCLSWVIETRGKGLNSVFHRYRLWYVVGAIFVVLNIFFAQDWHIALYHWVKVVELGFVGYYMVKAKFTVFDIQPTLAAAVVYASLIGLAQALLQRSVGGPFWFLGERTFTVDTPGIARAVINGQEWLRAYSTFPHPNVFAGFLALTIPLLSMSVGKAKMKITKMLVITAVVLGSIALVLTFSRSALIVSALGVSWIFRKKQKFLFLFPLLLLFVLPFSFQEESYVVRNQLNMSAIQMTLSHPFFGVGLGNFLVSLPEVLPTRTIYFLQPVHNIYLLLLAEIGILGSLGCIYLLIRTLKHITWYPPILGILLLGFVDHYFLTLQQGRIMALVFFCLAVSMNKKVHASSA